MHSGSVVRTWHTRNTKGTRVRWAVVPPFSSLRSSQILSVLRDAMVSRNSIQTTLGLLFCTQFFASLSLVETFGCSCDALTWSGWFSLCGLTVLYPICLSPFFCHPIHMGFYIPFCSIPPFSVSCRRSHISVTLLYY